MLHSILFDYTALTTSMASNEPTIGNLRTHKTQRVKDDTERAQWRALSSPTLLLILRLFFLFFVQSSTTCSPHEPSPRSASLSSSFLRNFVTYLRFSMHSPSNSPHHTANRHFMSNCHGFRVLYRNPPFNQRHIAFGPARSSLSIARAPSIHEPRQICSNIFFFYLHNYRESRFFLSP